MKFGQGKVSEFYFRLRVGTLLRNQLKIDKKPILMTKGSLMVDRKNCRMLLLEHSAILLTSIKQ